MWLNYCFCSLSQGILCMLHIIELIYLFLCIFKTHTSILYHILSLKYYIVEKFMNIPGRRHSRKALSTFAFNCIEWYTCFILILNKEMNTVIFFKIVDVFLKVLEKIDTRIISLHCGQRQEDLWVFRQPAQ